MATTAGQQQTAPRDEVDDVLKGINPTTASQTTTPTTIESSTKSQRTGRSFR